MAGETLDRETRGMLAARFSHDPDLKRLLQAVENGLVSDMLAVPLDGTAQRERLVQQIHGLRAATGQIEAWAKEHEKNANR